MGGHRQRDHSAARGTEEISRGLYACSGEIGLSGGVVGHISG